MVCRVFEEVLARYPQMQCPKYVVMPNHFHALVMIDKMNSVPTDAISAMMRSFKSKTTVEYIRLVRSGAAEPFNGKLWQRSYYDHVIRNQQDFVETWKYIENNPVKWMMGQKTE